MDFYQIRERNPRKGIIEIYPDFTVGRSKDLMVRGKTFYAIWDEDKQLWSTDEYDVARLVDKELIEYRKKIIDSREDVGTVHIKLMSEFSTKSWVDFKNYLSRVSDTSHQLDTRLTFLNTEVKKKDYVSKRLPYPLEEGSYDAFDEIIGTLYDPEERAKLEWAIGAVVAGDAKDIQKFIVLYGEAGGGKSTMLNIIQKLFPGYYTTFEAKALTSSNNTFSTEVFRGDPLVAIQHDADLSKIEDNTKLNSIVAHEDMTMNEKYKAGYTARANCFLFMATNQPVKISDAKSGILRRLIDVLTSGKKIPTKKYFDLMSQIDFELGAIAFHCLDVYRQMGKNYYSAYRPLVMMFKTDVFFNFIEENFLQFAQQDGTTLLQAYAMYKAYCDEALIASKLPKYKFRDELKNYFEEYLNYKRIGDKQLRNYYSGFIRSKFTSGGPEVKEEHPRWLVLDSTKSIFDEIGANFPAQYASDKEIPIKKWDKVTTHLSDIDTTKLHYVVVPSNHIVIDFDITDSNGEKSAEKNLEAATKWPPTYAEFSKSESGLHLHYIFDGDTSKLSNLFDTGIEVKVSSVGDVGPSSLRRKLTRCNNIPISTINSGLPLKEEKMINFGVVKSEKGLRDLILRNLHKDIHPHTRPSVDFIYKILEEVYKSGLNYDVTDMRPKVLAFANNSTHQAEYCVNLVSKMNFQSEEPSIDFGAYKKDELVFFDVEVFPNLFVVSWKYPGKEHKCVNMINPSAKDIEGLMQMKLVGFNCRRYDNHILYARYVGYDIEQLYALNVRIIGGSRNGLFGEAYNISYTDVYDFSSKKQSLKKFEIELGIHHVELGLPFDQPVPEEKWPLVLEYCGNDVIATEATFNDRKEDFVARQILSELSGLTVNDTTQMHTAKILFGNDPHPQDKFIYTDLSIEFPGYKFINGKSSYRGEDPGEGGNVYAEPGVYYNVSLDDVISMHATSLEILNLFGPYTERYSQLKAARVAIKHQDYDTAKGLLNGVLAKYLTTPEESVALAYALKIIILSVYGYTSAKFENKFRDPRNVDNIVAKRGALFMIDLKHAVQEQGFKVVHIKTDSIKIADATPEIITFVYNFGLKYGYVFEHEATFDRFCLLNDAVYVARNATGKHAGEWTSTGTQLIHPYVFKTLFSKEPIIFDDLCETKAVTSALYLDMNEGLEDVSEIDAELNERRRQGEGGGPRKYNIKFSGLSDEKLEELSKNGHDYHFIGKTGLFCPIKPGYGGGILLREKDGQYHAATGTKGYRWLEAEMVKNLGKEESIDLNYYRRLVDETIDDISKFVDFEQFVS